MITENSPNPDYPDRLITFKQVDGRTVWDGFTVRDIMESDGNDGEDLVHIELGAPRIRNVAILNNTVGRGFPFANRGGHVVFRNCLWQDNVSPFCTGLSQTAFGSVEGLSYFVNCTFRSNNNTGGFGVSICLQEGGGLMYLINCLFEKHANNAGAAVIIAVRDISPDTTAILSVQNCTFVSNFENFLIECGTFSTGVAEVDIVNSIFLKSFQNVFQHFFSFVLR